MKNTTAAEVKNTEIRIYVGTDVSPKGVGMYNLCVDLPDGRPCITGPVFVKDCADENDLKLIALGRFLRHAEKYISGNLRGEDVSYFVGNSELADAWENRLPEDSTLLGAVSREAVKRGMNLKLVAF